MELKYRLKHRLKHRMKYINTQFKTQFKTWFKTIDKTEFGLRLLYPIQKEYQVVNNSWININL